MKKFKILLLTLFITTAICSMVICTSCNKSTCAGVVCQNGGICLSGSCSCPSGYSGVLCEKAATSTVAYYNNTFTPVSISINGVNTIIPVAGTASFTGAYGTAASGAASTSGSTPLGVITGGGIVGDVINWDLYKPFPVQGTVYDTLNIGASYFYLTLTNHSNYSIINFTANNGSTTGGVLNEAVTIPDNGQSYGLGYYQALPNSNIQVTYSNGSVYLLGVSLPFTNNQMFFADVSN